MPFSARDADSVTKYTPNVGIDLTYSCGVATVAAVASATDVVQLTGAASYVARIRRVSISTVPIGTVQTYNHVYLFRRSTAASGGTQAAVTTGTKYNNTGQAAQITVTQITASAATAGTAAGTIRNDVLQWAPVSTLGQPMIALTWTFGDRGCAPLELRGTSDFITIGFAGVTPVGVFDWNIEWDEASGSN